MTLKQIQKATAAQIYPSIEKEISMVVISELVTDTRKVQEPSQSLFIALKGDFRDGHTFIQTAYNLGIRNFLVEQIPEKSFPQAVFLLVDNSLEALHKIAQEHRSQFNLPVIGITGSNGKTIVKEWLFQLLADSYNIVRSPKSYNSQIGVPLSIWNIKPENNLGLFEAGISKPGEMALLEPIIRPTLGLFTNIGDAHNEGFENRNQKIHEKLALFQRVNTLFYCQDHQEIHQAVLVFQNEIKEKTGHLIHLCTWSKKEEATLKINAISKSEEGMTTIIGVYEGQSYQIQIPFTDDASIENAIHCWLIGLKLGISNKHLSAGFKGLHPIAMRLQKAKGINHTILINDAYNSDLTSFKIALNTLSQQKEFADKTIILSDILQTGLPPEQIYKDIALWISEKGIKRFIGVGPTLSANQFFFKDRKNLESSFYNSTSDFLKAFSKLTFENEAILIKGARTFGFEKIEHLLEQKVHQTILEINLSAIVRNVKVYKNLLPKEVKMMAMVKAFSYGSGSTEIAHTLEKAGLDYFGVAYIDEGVALRKAGIQTPIMVMNPESGTLERLVSWELEPEIYSRRSLMEIIKLVEDLNIYEYPIHLMLDTGMHRLGFTEKDIKWLQETLAESKRVRVASIFSHLSGSGGVEFDAYTQKQIDSFQNMAKRIGEVLKQKPLWHILNSTGITRHSKYHFDMVRLGIGLYGIDLSNVLQDQLEATSKLVTRIAQIRELQPGDLVGYDCRGEIKQNSRIATVNIGYADGYFRKMSNNHKSYVTIRGKKAFVIGSICMDMCMVDITSIPEAKEGDEVVVFGQSPLLSELADWAETIPYEIMTGISQRVNRIYFEE